MIKLGELNSPNAAHLFADYCVTQGWSVQAVVEGAERAALYVEESQLQQVSQALEAFLHNPGHPRYHAAAWQRSKVATGSGAAPLWSGLQFKAFSGPVTLLVLVLAMVVYGWQQIAPQQASAALGIFLQPAAINLTESWRWFSPALLHFSLTHLVFNLLWWWLLAGQFERRLGSGQLLSFTLSSALIANVAQYLLVGPYFGGLSGVVYALFGYFWWAGRLNPAQGLRLDRGLVAFMLIWMLLGFLDLLWVSMANWAHLGGLLAGCGWAWLLRHKPGRPD
ncbi:rhomboid family intramembrane serine protease GlpG [Alkalimonas sp.]|uniref:rhomboid family intramembrane serine protease GlpG n=1 Tax=Alkalimonas sp. TaxID=1872453 RepID=UPI00263A8995|nr:rhomboid family intramembrane serine protease GlpG [Alkalimonas sp.]MCC5827136.1 rhomboid family intramembrane serine protease GlpG [Alkalimonas sp.]